MFSLAVILNITKDWVTPPNEALGERPRAPPQKNSMALRHFHWVNESTPLHMGRPGFADTSKP